MLRCVGMINNRRSIFPRVRALPARAMAWVLLVPIAYALTFGTAHTHASARSEFSLDRVSSEAPSPTAVSADFLLGRSSCYECLVCLFRQQLSNSTVPQTMFVGRPEVRVVSTTATTSDCYSVPAASSRVQTFFG